MTNYGWQSVELNQVPPHFRDWLAKPYQLAQTLRNHGVNLQLQLLSQEQTLLPPAEAALVQNEQALLRQIYLTDGQVPLTYGRTIVPQQTLVQHVQDLAALGNKPIGETLLYNNPNVIRSPFEFACIAPGTQLYQDATVNLAHLTMPLFARRSLFHIAELPLLIIEIFFPELPPYAA